MFEGFTEEARDWYWELLLHNERPWFEEHREGYLRLLKEPMEALAKETLALMEEKYPRRHFHLHVARIYRDARRLFGRGPYKNHLWFSLGERERWDDGPCFWFELGPEGWSCGCSFYAARAEQMERWREVMDANPAGMERLARRLRRQRAFQLEGEEYKRPRGERGPLLNPWYNRKQLGLCSSHDFEGVLLTPELPRSLTEAFCWLMPYYEQFMKIFEE